MLAVVVVLSAVITLATAAVLVRLYLRTRNSGYVLIALAIPLWPLLWALPGFVGNWQVDKVAVGGDVGFPLSLIDARMNAGEVAAIWSWTGRLFQSALLLAGFLLLSRRGTEVTQEPAREGEPYSPARS